MPAYDRRWFDPPAPLASVTVGNPGNSAAVPDVPMLLDSGADVTLLPEGVLASLGMTFIPGKQHELVGFDGSMSFARVVRLEMVFCRRRFTGQFGLIDQEWGVRGRNVLNAVALILGGLNLGWRELASG